MTGEGDRMGEPDAARQRGDRGTTPDVAGGPVTRVPRDGLTAENGAVRATRVWRGVPPEGVEYDEGLPEWRETAGFTPDRVREYLTLYYGADWTIEVQTTTVSEWCPIPPGAETDQSDTEQHTTSVLPPGGGNR